MRIYRHLRGRTDVAIILHIINHMYPVKMLHIVNSVVLVQVQTDKDEGKGIHLQMQSIVVSLIRQIRMQNVVRCSVLKAIQMYGKIGTVIH